MAFSYTSLTPRILPLWTTGTVFTTDRIWKPWVFRMLLDKRMPDLVSSSCIWKGLPRDRENTLKLRGGEEGIKEFQKIHDLRPHVRQKPVFFQKPELFNSRELTCHMMVKAPQLCTSYVDALGFLKCISQIIGCFSWKVFIYIYNSQFYIYNSQLYNSQLYIYNSQLQVPSACICETMSGK